jgi:hypothetical protein
MLTEEGWQRGKVMYLRLVFASRKVLIVESVVFGREGHPFEARVVVWYCILASFRAGKLDFSVRKVELVGFS